nr:NIb [Hyacinth mosaic virus]
ANTDNWVECELKGNLKAVARCPGNLVTKHTYKGKCALFNLYLSTHPEELEYFKPKLGAYQKSRLNKAAYLNDIMKYSTTIEVGVVDTTLFEQTLDAFEEKLRNIGFEDCVYVLDQQAIFDSLNMKSAVGALYGGKKRDYFKDFQDSDKSEILKQSCERLYTGQFGVWNGSLKAELRPKEKVELNKTRTFTAAPLDTLLGGKACVDDFNNQFYNFHLKGPWSVGMTKFFKGWDRMLKLLPDGWVYCDADGSQFDSSLSPYLLNAILELRLRFIEEWDIGEKMLSNLYTEIIYTPIATPDGTIIKKFKGNNSGQPSTVVDNTLMVILVLMHSLRKEGIPFDEQDNVCRYFVNGDDLLLAVEPAHEHILDRLAQDFLEFGLKYDFTSRSRDKGDVWFMSQRGHLIDDMYIPKLEEERIVSILEWDRSVEPQHRLEAICASMIEAWGHTRLLHEIRKFYAWVLEQAPYSEIAKMGGAPYISETALRRLYTLEEVADDELLRYLDALYDVDINENDMEVRHQ